MGDLYMKGWEKGLKGITVYVDGSRSGVLVTKDEKKDKCAPNWDPQPADKSGCGLWAYRNGYL